MVVASLCWSGNFIIGKFATLFEIPPLTLNVFRWISVWFILIPFTYKEIYRNINYIKKNFLVIGFMGVITISTFNSVVYFALNYTQVINAVLVLAAIPALTIILSSLMKIEKTNLFQIIGVILSFIGVITILTKANFEILKNLDFNKGDITMVLAMFSWALYSTLLKKQKYELSQLSLLQTIMSFGLIFLIPVYFIEYKIGFRINLDAPFILILSYVVLFPGLASFILWIKGISLIGANRSGVFLHLMPILSAIMAMIFFSEKFMFYHMLGACFIIIGILLSNKKVRNA